MAGTLQHVHPMVRIAGMYEDLLILLEPRDSVAIL